MFTSDTEQALKEREAIKDALAQILGRLKSQSSLVTSPETTISSSTIKELRARPAGVSSDSTSSTDVPTTQPVITKEDLKLRAALLAKNKELSRLHKELVLPGLITEEEFWESRRHLLLSQQLQNKQKKGLPSSLLADIRPTTDTSSSDIKYTLTPAIIHSIFLQYPQVHRIYQENVPDKVLYYGNHYSQRIPLIYS